MPFELGLAMGARRFGGKRQRNKTRSSWWLSPIACPPTSPISVATIRQRIIAIRTSSSASCVTICIPRRPAHHLPDPRSSSPASSSSKADLPAIAAPLGIQRHEIDPYGDYRTYMWFIAEFLKTVQTGIL